MPHDLGGVVAPDLVGEMQSQIFSGTPGMFREGAWQHRGGIGDQDGLLRHMLGKLLIEGDLLLRIFGDRLDDKIGVPRGLFVARRERDALERGHDLRLELVDLLGRGQIGVLQDFELGLRAIDRPFGANPYRDVESLIGGLEGDLASQDPATGHDDILDFHALLLSPESG